MVVFPCERDFCGMEYYYKTIFFSQTEGPVYVIIDHLYLLKYHKYFLHFVCCQVLLLAALVRNK